MPPCMAARWVVLSRAFIILRQLDWDRINKECLVLLILLSIVLAILLSEITQDFFYIRSITYSHILILMLIGICIQPYSAAIVGLSK